MVDYCTKEDVQAVFKNLTISNSAVITDTIIGNWITQSSAKIDAYITEYYELPITGVSSLEILKSICVDITAYQVAETLSLKKNLPIPDDKILQDLSHGSAYKQAIKMLDKISKGDIKLPDEDPKSSAPIMRSSYTDPGYVDNVIFKKGVDQW